MKYFRADLHVHSRFSRATSGRLNIRNLAAWSMIKGLSVMSTGDFTHPAWRDELRRDLVYDDNSGLYRVREKTPLETEIPGFSRPDGVSEPQFLIQAEISSIYKKDGSVRKVHNVVIMPSLESADKLSNKLAAIGNITSDGRPILGLDCEHLLEMVLEADERGVLIPAHIWTPWFSLFGSKSGFDALEDCFGSLSSHIFALETGLSSDPDMNRLWSALDRYALVSNSDAHSGENLGREANLFEGTPSYDGIFDALRRAARDEEGSGCIYRGTVEFFPEEGKYHLDGHRACNVVLEPEESMKIGNICPVCGKPLTVGVLHRVMARFRKCSANCFPSAPKAEKCRKGSPNWSACSVRKWIFCTRSPSRICVSTGTPSARPWPVCAGATSSRKRALTANTGSSKCSRKKSANNL